MFLAVAALGVHSFIYATNSEWLNVCLLPVLWKQEWAEPKQVPASKGLHPSIALESVTHAWDLGQPLVGEQTDG